MLLGPKDLKNVQMPATIDGEELRKVEMVEGATYEEVLSDINDALDVAEEELQADPLLSTLVYTTTRLDVEYRGGDTDGFEDSTEYGEGDEQMAETAGHMLPIKAQDRKLGWSKAYLEIAKLFQIESDIANAIDDYKDAVQKRALTRLFSNTKETGKALGLGNGASVPFLDGGASGVTYTPPRGRDGMTFQSTHNHYLRLDGITQANLETVVEHLWEHKHDGPFDLLISQDDVADWTDKSAVTGFKERGNTLVAYGQNETLATVEDIFIGVITTKRGPVRVMANGRIPTNYWNLRKSFEKGDSRNAIYERVDPRFGSAPKLVVPVAKLIPVQNAIIQYKKGYGVGADLTVAVNVLNAASGTYTNPTIS